MHKDFKAVGISYKNTPLDVRELLSFNEQACKRLLRFFKEFTDIPEAMVLSTCNRTEVYYSSPIDRSEEIIKLIGLERDIEDLSRFKEYFITYNDERNASNHLFDVAIGLEAQVVGDLQIINQVKNAYQWSADEDLAGPFLHRLLHTIFFTNKRIVQETAFRDGAASVSYVTVELIDGLVQNHESPNVLVLGLGEIGADVCRNLVSLDKANVTVSNRTRSKADEIALECGFDTIALADALKSLDRYDVIVSSIESDQATITPELLREGSLQSYRYFFDLSVPRSIAQDIEDIPGVLLYNIDGIQNKASKALERRMAAIPRVRSIIGESLEEFSNWTREMEVSPTINKLKNALEEIRREEIARFLKNSSEEENKIVDKVTKSMIQKIIKLPVLQLKAACKRGEATTLIEVLNDLFELEKQSEELSK